MTAFFCTLFLSIGPDELLREIGELRKSMREKKVEAEAAVKAAHELLDAGAYEEAVQRHRKSRELEREVGDLKKSEKAAIAKAVPLLVPRLDDDSADVRTKASAQLVSLGSLGIPHLEALEAEGSVELQSRLADVLLKLRLSSLDDEGRVRQWAASARASSEYGADHWSAKQATGKPDTAGPGDIRTAWASRVADGGEEWLELTYDQPVLATHVRIHETYNPGAVRKVEARDAEGNWKVLWEGSTPTQDPARWLLIAFRPAPVVTSTIRVVLDSAGVPGWNEIDAVELIGDSGKRN